MVMPDEDVERARAQAEAERRYDDSFLPEEEHPPGIEEPLGYVCLVCGWWVPTLSLEDEHCRHPRVEPIEYVEAERLRGARRRAHEGRAAPR